MKALRLFNILLIIILLIPNSICFTKNESKKEIKQINEKLKILEENFSTYKNERDDEFNKTNELSKNSIEILQKQTDHLISFFQLITGFLSIVATIFGTLFTIQYNKNNKLQSLLESTKNLIEELNNNTKKLNGINPQIEQVSTDLMNLQQQNIDKSFQIKKEPPIIQGIEPDNPQMEGVENDTR